MTRHSPSEAALGEIPVSGLHANFTLLSAFNDAVGKEVLLELVDGSVFTGIFGGASSEMEVGLYCAYEKTPENEKNLLPIKKEIVQKRQFNFSDIVCVTVPTNDEKIIKGFATDRDYHNKRKPMDGEDNFEEWEGDGEDVELESEEAVKAVAKTTARNGGWGVNEMFAANQSLGVKTTFEDNLSQYTTAEVEGTDEDRRRADEIARQIEKSGSSRMYSALENDDEERDLDKMTEEAELLGSDAKNKNWSDGSSTTPAVSVPNENGWNGSASISSTPHQTGQSPRPIPLMNTVPPGFPSPPGYNNSLAGYITVTGGRGRKGPSQSDHSHNTYLPLVNRGVNNNVRGGTQLTPKNNRAEGLKGELRRPSNSGGFPPVKGAPLPSPKGAGGQGGQGPYVKRDSYDGPGGGGQTQNYDSWNSKGGMKTFDNTKVRGDQKMILENRNTASNSPRNVGGPPSGPSIPNNQKGGASGRVEGLKAWQNDFNPSYRETRPMQKGPGEKMDVQSAPQPTPLLESAPPTKNAWQSGPPSGLTSSSRCDESKSGPSPSNSIPTPAEMKMSEEREGVEEAGASTSHEEERTGEMSGGEKKEDADTSKDSCGKKFSFNPDAPAFTPKFGAAGGGMAAPPTLPPTPMMNMPLPTTLMPTQPMPMQAQMSGMGGMQQPAMIYTYPTQPHYPNMQQNMQYSAVVNGGAIMAGAAQNGQGQTGGTPSTPRGANGGQGGGMGGGPRQRPGVQGGTGGAVPVTMSGGMYMQPGVNYQPVAIPQQAYMQTQPGYYPYNGQPQMIQGAYTMPMSMQQQGMMGTPQRAYVPQATHPGMMMQYNVQQQYGGGPSGTGQQGGPPMGNTSQGGGGSTPSVSTNGPPSNGSGTGQGGVPSHPPSQPPTPGAVSSQSASGVPSQTGMLPTPTGPGMVPAPVPSPGMYGMQYGGPGVMYYQGAAPMGGMEMHGGEGQETIHPMHYQYNAGQYYQNAPPHLRAAYPTMNHGMPQQQQHAPAQPSQSQN